MQSIIYNIAIMQELKSYDARPGDKRYWFASYTRIYLKNRQHSIYKIENTVELQTKLITEFSTDCLSFPNYNTCLPTPKNKWLSWEK